MTPPTYPPDQYDWYLSFAGEEEFRGAVIVPDCDTFEAAHLKASLAGINPGGEV